MSDSKAVAKRPADTDLMPPPPLPKRIKRPQKVLDEDTYTSSLSYIIARDYFPGLLESQTQQEFLDALDSKDAEWIADATKRAQEAMTPGHVRGRRGVSMTPQRDLQNAADTPRSWRGGTPSSVRSSTATPARGSDTPMPGVEKSEPDVNMSLAEFQSKYTSEDNESFNKVLDKQNTKRRERYGWMWNANKLPSKRQIAQAAQQKQLQQQPSSTDPASSTALTLHDDQRPASVDPPPIPYDPKNTVFFAPDNLSTTPSAPANSVNHNSTRLPLSRPPTTSPTPSSPVPSSPALSAIDAALAGRPRARSVTTAAPSDAGSEQGSNPSVNGYTYVDDDTAASPSSTLLSDMLASATTAPAATPFTIGATSRRETLHHKLVAKQSATRRPNSSSSSDGSSHTPREARHAQLTPAGQRLAQRIGGGSATPARAGTKGSDFGWDEGRGKGWTPTPLRLRRGAK